MNRRAFLALPFVAAIGTKAVPLELPQVPRGILSINTGSIATPIWVTIAEVRALHRMDLIEADMEFIESRPINLSCK